MWHNMREEPNVYINGRPYVLREDERPYKNLQEYAGIDYQRLQRMEVREVRYHDSPKPGEGARSQPMRF